MAVPDKANPLHALTLNGGPFSPYWLLCQFVCRFLHCLAPFPASSFLLHPFSQSHARSCRECLHLKRRFFSTWKWYRSLSAKRRRVFWKEKHRRSLQISMALILIAVSEAGRGSTLANRQRKSTSACYGGRPLWLYKSREIRRTKFEINAVTECFHTRPEETNEHNEGSGWIVTNVFA